MFLKQQQIKQQIKFSGLERVADRNWGQTDEQMDGQKTAWLLYTSQFL